MKSSNKNNPRAFLNLSIILMILFGVTLGCLGPSASDYACQGIVKADGKTYEGAGKTEEKAGLHACNKYCQETDPELESMYQIWLDGPKAKELEELHGKKPTKFDAIMEEKRMLDYQTENCAVRCVKDAKDGKHDLKTSCKK